MTEPNDPQSAPATSEEKAAAPPVPTRTRWRRYRILVPIALIAVIAVLLATDNLRHLPGIPILVRLRHHEAHAVLFVSQTEPTIVGAAPGEDKAATTDFETYKQTQSALIKSRIVLNAALRNPKISALVANMEDPMDWLEDNLRTDFDMSPELMRVSLKGKKPQDLIIILNAVVDAYMDEVISSESKARLERLQKLKDASSRSDDALRTKRRVLKDLAEATGTASTLVQRLQEQYRQVEFSELTRELVRVRIALKTAMIKLAHFQAKKNEDPQNQAARQSLETELALLIEQEKVFGQEMQKVTEELRLSVKSGIDIEAAKEEVEAVAAVAKKLRDKIEIMQLELNQPNRVMVQDRAEVRVK